MKKLSIKNLVWKEGKYYVARALNMEVSSFGKTRREALKNLIEALSLYVEGEPKIEYHKISRPTISRGLQS
ncbi:MAG: type II toxin-antitoxin system HicB family antitoxin [Patescibacteria group bacterium]|nr:type II toxin-antitoxin system HicB family antitoxin [Patescibacteria group bacterium]